MTDPSLFDDQSSGETPQESPEQEAERLAFERRRAAAAVPSPPADTDQDVRWWPHGLPLEDELARVRSLLEAAAWKFAKTLSHNPHYYTLRWTWSLGDEDGDADFAFVVAFIRQWGYKERFPPRPSGKEYTLLRLGGFKYWTMGAPIGPVGKDAYNRDTDTILINRKPADAS